MSVGHPLALGVVRMEPDVEPSAALASLPDAEAFVLYPADETPPRVPGATALLPLEHPDRYAAARRLHACRPEAVVVIVQADERVSSELAAAVLALREDAVSGEYAARTRVRFLGREMAGPAVPVAWLGEPGRAACRRLLDGALERETRDVTAMIATLDAVASRLAVGRDRIRRSELAWRPLVGLARRLWLRRGDGVPGLILSALETYGDLLTSAKAWERVALTGRGTGHRGRDVPEGYRRIETPAGFLLVRADVCEALRRPLMAASPERVDGHRLMRGGRGRTWRLDLGAHGRAVLRWYQRGGLFAGFLGDRYFGWRPRPSRELTLTDEVRRRGIPAPEVLGVRVDRRRAGWYTGALVTREVEDAETLAEVLARRPPAAEREEVLVAVGRGVRRMHDRGVHHRDLNAANVLVRRRATTTEVSFIDFDRARLRTTLPGRLRRRALARLARSLTKLGRAGVPLEASDMAVLQRGYVTGGADG